MRRKTAKMLAFEARVGKPVDVALSEAINRLGSLPRAAEELDLSYDTALRWVEMLRIEMRTVAELPATPARRSLDQAAS